MDPWFASRLNPEMDSDYERSINLDASGMSQSDDGEYNSFNKKKPSRVPMVSDMIITHHDNAMKDRLSGKSHAAVTMQMAPHMNAEQCNNLEGEMQQLTERTGQHRNQAKNISKEDPMSHRIIEKRRRDRMNNCLADLSRLIPAEYMKKGRGRVEKTEIIEMAIKHMKYLQSNVSSTVGNQPPPRSTKEPKEPVEIEKSENSTPVEPENSILMADQYKMGFLECLTETMQYLVEGHGYPPNHGLCLSLINHLQQHCAQIVKGKQVIHDVMKQEIILEVNKFNANVLTYLDGDGAYDESGQQKNSSKNSKSHTSVNASYDQTLADRCSMSFTTDSYSSSGSMYKFKTDIKQRFSAENSGEDLADYYAPAKKRRRKESSDCTEDRQEVPIFALHANGSYYIPLTVNRDIIPPVLDHALTENRSSVIVHPISISVNFQATNQF
ncbi:uncharacterized protein LOC114119594 isoform X1 [Aphis gossypii]|uniref:BHLH domain-containing protein n=2 Tax=Aphis gossypii TaxID=80765 RepID=A0A9P0IVP4_APHGO|nr:uncharacterized protein LOC114119594 isoform X1 [Aphis gossypii]CAH1713984.1 unnamed protein product [Aphis gossypii]